jgi:hypothetical protein
MGVGREKQQTRQLILSQTSDFNKPSHCKLCEHWFAKETGLSVALAFAPPKDKQRLTNRISFKE